VQEARRQEAEGFYERKLTAKLFNLFQLDSYFRHAALGASAAPLEVKSPLSASLLESKI
jgi:hypothetical protein